MVLDAELYMLHILIIQSYDNLKFRKFSRNISGNIDTNMQINELMIS